MILDGKTLDFLIEPLPHPKPILLVTLDEIYRGVTSPVELIEKSLSIIRNNSRLNAFITILENEALKMANEVERRLGQGLPLGPLAGLPISIKDNIYMRGVRTTMASKIFSDYIPGINATVISRLLDSDAIIIGKTNLHEFASGVTNISSYFGPARNPHDPERVPGGSSGGSAISVAIGAALASLGTDTSGSIRIPAALCGVVGYKPSYGLISRYGVFPLAWSLDTVGVLSNSVLDAAYVASILVGPDGFDTSIVQDFRLDISLIKREVNPKKIVLGYIQVDENNPVERKYMDLSSLLNAEGFNLMKIDIDFERINSVHRVIRLTEAAAIHKDLFMKRSSDYSYDVADMIRQGLGIPAVDYINALRQRTLIINEIERIFNVADVIITPTVPAIAPRINDVMGKELDFRVVATRYVAMANLLGSPAVSIPAGNVEGMPVGLQIIGKILDDNKTLMIARSIETILRK
ncbi:MAG: amidase [Vulcanisaeta sp.]|jgi:aspartyl-tRNA(Asn)/glutamyl-tRNA(Gln) amidotransferase subunit A|nr:amidase [Vulcanisaeta sp.]